MKELPVHLSPSGLINELLLYKNKMINNVRSKHIDGYVVPTDSVFSIKTLKQKNK
jgi:hypothetical protein